MLVRGLGAGLAAALGVAATLLGVAVLVLGLGLALAQTEYGRRQLAGLAESLLTGPDARAEVSGLAGSIPFDVRLQRLALADPEGVWLEVEGARLDWSPRALLRGRLHVEEVGAARVALYRLPADDGTEPEPDADEPFSLPELPQVLPPVTVDRLAIERIDVGPPVLGEAASFALAGRIAVAPDGSTAAANLDLTRIDEATARVDLDATLRLASEELTLSLVAEETGGLLAGVTDIPEAGAFRLRLTGSGPLGSWSGRLDATAEGVARIESDIALALAARPSIALDGRLAPGAGLLPPDVAALVGEAIGFSLTATRTAEQRLAVADLTLTTDLARIDGEALLDLEARRVEAMATARVDDLAPLSDLAGTPLAGSLALVMDAVGPLTQPSIAIELRAQDLSAPPVAVARATADIDLAPLRPDAPGFAGLRVVAGGAVEGLALTGGPELPEDTLRWDVAATVPAEGVIEVERLAVAAGDLLDLAATGTIDPAGPAGDVRVRLAAGDLAPLAAFAGQEIRGAAELTANVAVRDAGDRLRAELDGRLSGLEGLPPGAAQLLGREVALSADAEVRPGGRFEVTGIAVDGAAAALRGDVGFEFVNGRLLSGELTLALPRLAALEPVAERPLEGEARVVAHLAGTLEAPEVRLDLTAADVAAAGQRFDAVEARLSAEGLPAAPHGELRLTAERGGQRLTAGAGYRLEGQTLALADLRLSAPATELIGDALTVRLDGPLVEGRLSGRSRELAALGALIGVPDIAGRLVLTLDLRAQGGRQALTLAADADELTGDFGRITELDLRAEVTDALTAPKIDATAQLARFRSGETFVREATLRAAGGLAGLDVTASAAGQQTVPFNLDAAARVDLAGDATTVRLDRLDGRVAFRPVSLTRPATLTVGGGSAALRDLELAIASGRLRASGTYGPERVEAEAALERLPLGVLAAFGAPALAGTADARLQLTGPPSGPEGTLTASVTDLRPEDPAYAGLPATAVTARATLSGRRLDAELRAEGLTDRAVTARLEAPLVLALEPFTVELPGGGALRGGLNAETRLERLAQYFAPPNQELAGLLRADLTLGGTVADPSVAGEVTVTDGGYENGDTGTVLRDITLRATGTQQRIVVSELTATDGGSGRIRGSGSVSLDPTGGFPFDLALRLNQATLVRQVIATATLSGEVRVSGDATEALAAGDLTVDRAEIGLAGGIDGGPDIPTLDVVEIGPAGEPVEGPEAEDEEPPLTVNLGIGIELPGRVFVRGRGLDSEWQGRLTVRGTVENPEIVGTLSIRRGELAFLDRTLNLREGRIEFTGASPPVPTVDLTAVAEAGDFTAVVRVSGPATNPQFELTSEPPLPQDEILSRLLFNRPAGGITAAQAVQLAAAVNQLRGGGPGLLGGLRRALGVDVLDIGGDADTGPTVRAGRYLSDDVFVEVERGAQEGTGRATVEVEILPSVTLEAEVREDSRTGVGVQWRYDY